MTETTAKLKADLHARIANAYQYIAEEGGEGVMNSQVHDSLHQDIQAMQKALNYIERTGATQDALTQLYLAWQNQETDSAEFAQGVARTIRASLKEMEG